MFYICLGHIARIFNLNFISVFHVFRALGAVFLLCVLWQLLSRIFEEEKSKRMAFIWLTIAGGMGWIPFVFGYLPTDFSVAEMYVFLSSLANPHFPIGSGLQVWLLLPSSVNIQKMKGRAKIFVAALLLVIISPFSVPIVLVVWSSYLVWQIGKRQDLIEAIWRIVLMGLGAGPMLIYYFVTSRTHPVLAIWNAQNITASPPLWDTLLGLSPAIFIAVFGFRQLWISKKDTGNILVIWAFLSLALAYVPFSLQRRFLTGISIPVVVIAAFTLTAWIEKRKIRSSLAFIFLFIFLAPTVLLNFLVVRFGVESAESSWFLESDEVAMFEWVDENLPNDALILASTSSSLFIPGRTGNRVLIGHPFETANYQIMDKQVVDFFTGGLSDQESKYFIESLNVDYVLCGPREKELGEIDLLSNSMILVTKIGEVSLFQARK